MEFFDAQTEWTFAEFVGCLRDLGAPFGETPDPPTSGYSIQNERRGSPLIAGYSDEFGCHLVSPDRAGLEELSALTQALTPS